MGAVDAASRCGGLLQQHRCNAAYIVAAKEEEEEHAWRWIAAANLHLFRRMDTDDVSRSSAELKSRSAAL